MPEIAIPALLYVTTNAPDGEQAHARGVMIRDRLDKEPPVTVQLPDHVTAELRPNMDGEVLLVEGYRTPAGETSYEVTLELTVDGGLATPADWPDDDAAPGNYMFTVEARNIYEAVEAAKDAFHETHAVADLDRIDLDAISAARLP